MTKDELLVELEETLQRDEPLSVDMVLEDVEEWDSLAYISTISLYDQLFSVLISHEQLGQCESVQDLIALVSDKLD